MATDTKQVPPVTGIVPYLQVADAAAAAELYKKAFGAEELRREAMEGKVIHLHLRINGGNLFLADPFPEQGHPLEKAQGYTLHLQVDDADKWFQRAVDAGVLVTMPIALQFWGDRYGQLKDKFGVSWSIGGPNR
jgi:uncharacterized glyoxalase superfamily protein PhnB